MKRSDFEAVTFTFNDKKGKRMFLSKEAMNRLTAGMHDYFRSTVNVPSVKRGNKQEIESLINEEAILLAKYLRAEKEGWEPRVVPLIT